MTLALMDTLDTQNAIHVLVAVIPIKPPAVTRKVDNVNATQTLLDFNVTLALMGSMNIHIVMDLQVSDTKSISLFVAHSYSIFSNTQKRKK